MAAMKSFKPIPVIVFRRELAQFTPVQPTCVCSNGERVKPAAPAVFALLTTLLFHGAAMAASRDPVHFICKTSGIADPAAFCGSVASSLGEALGTQVVHGKDGAAADGYLVARLKFAVTGRSGNAVMETGKVKNGKFIPASSETTGVQTMDTSVERGAAKLIANILASRLRNQ